LQLPHGLLCQTPTKEITPPTIRFSPISYLTYESNFLLIETIMDARHGNSNARGRKNWFDRELEM